MRECDLTGDVSIRSTQRQLVWLYKALCVGFDQCGIIYVWTPSSIVIR